MFRAAAILLCAFGSVQDDPPEVRAAVGKIRAGGVPEKLSELRHPRVLDAIAERIRAGKPCAEALLLHLCAHATRSHAEAVLSLLDHATVKIAYAAVFALAALLDEKLLGALEPKLDADRDVQIRALTVLAEARLPAAAPLVEKRTSLLDPADRERSKAMLRAAAACRARRAHDAVMAYYEKTEDDQAVRALGRMWERKLDAAPLERAEEIPRLSALLLARRLALGGATNETFCDAMLRILAKDEFAKFLADFAGERFFARRVVAAAAMSRGFDRAKGTRLVEAFLANPDPGLVAQILVRSPWELPKGRLAALLARAEEPKIDDAPAHARLCDLAAWRLTLQIDRREEEIPPEVEKRDAIIRAWKERLAR